MTHHESVRLTVGEQSLDLGVEHATEGNNGINIAPLLKETGDVTYDPGFMNTANAKSAVTYIDGDQGILRYRGYPIDQIAANSTYLETAWLLIYGELPTAEQLDFSNQQVAAARERLRGRIVIDYVVPDYHAERPKACMGGWGRQVMNITPAGKVLPCHAAETLTNMQFAQIKDHSLADVWQSDPAFVAYRGTAWMPEPCRSCSRKEIDWGGCRCQAFALTGDAANTDPACSLSPHHHLMGEAVAASEDTELSYRRMGAN